MKRETFDAIAFVLILDNDVRRRRSLHAALPTSFFSQVRSKAASPYYQKVEGRVFLLTLPMGLYGVNDYLVDPMSVTVQPNSCAHINVLLLSLSLLSKLS